VSISILPERKCSPQVLRGGQLPHTDILSKVLATELSEVLGNNILVTIEQTLGCLIQMHCEQLSGKEFLSENGSDGGETTATR
jgi:hypothetical protein